jgi:hypothetical protein
LHGYIPFDLFSRYWVIRLSQSTYHYNEFSQDLPVIFCLIFHLSLTNRAEIFGRPAENFRTNIESLKSLLLLTVNRPSRKNVPIGRPLSLFSCREKEIPAHRIAGSADSFAGYARQTIRASGGFQKIRAGR